MTLLLNAQSLSKHYGSRTLFENITFTIQDDERIGLIGPNGAGKSTLLKILNDTVSPDDGKIEKVRNTRIAYISQEDEFPPDATVESVLFDALKDSHLEEHQCWTRVAKQMGKLGFEGADVRIDTLSGGWRKRVAIGRQLITEPDLLLIDEPTNHLDLAGIYWLEQFLHKANFPFVLISHDRYFLEKVTNRIIELNPRYPEGFFSVRGRYSDFLEKRENFLISLNRQEQSLASSVKREVEWLRRGPPARTTKANARIDEAHRKIDNLSTMRNKSAQDGNITVSFNASNRKTNNLVVAKDIEKSMGDKKLFDDMEIELSPGTRMGILGNNGSGKTTLLKVLAGLLEPDKGYVRHAPQLRVAMFEQHREQLDPTQTLRHALSPNGDHLTFNGNSVHVVSWAKRFLFEPYQLDNLVGSLSGGEQARIMIARMMEQPADLLLLDEPTNDLDIPSLEVLENGLMDFPGAIVLITHDRHMLDRICNCMAGLHDEGPASMYADLGDWEREQDARARAIKAEAVQAKPERVKAKPKAAKLSYNEKKELKNMEKNILAAEAEVEKQQAVIADPTIATDHARMHEECELLHKAEATVAQLYQRWEELEGKQ